jgi:hypothetical protein
MSGETCNAPYPVSEGWEDMADVRCGQLKGHEGDHKSHKLISYTNHSSILPLRWSDDDK